MIPLHGDNPTRTFSFVTFTLIIANVLVFVRELSGMDAFVHHYALVPAALVEVQSWREISTIFTSMFLHGSWMHLIGNMLYLWIFGINVEDAIGHFRFIVFYLLCGLGAAAAQVLVSPDSIVPVVGASGAVSGVLGAYLLLFPRARVLVLVPIWFFLRFIYVPAWLMLVVWFGVQLLSGLVVTGINLHGGVAFWAHVGGFVAGMALILILEKRRVKLFQ
jgi:membrane associated rhomboid family serine protease